MGKSTINDYKWPFSIAMLNYQRVYNLGTTLQPFGDSMASLGSDEKTYDPSPKIADPDSVLNQHHPCNQPQCSVHVQPQKSSLTKDSPSFMELPSGNLT